MSVEQEARSRALGAKQSVRAGRHPISAELSKRPVLPTATGISAVSVVSVVRFQLSISSLQLATGLHP